MEKYNVVSLFSGAMGLDIGLESTGRFRVVACVEKDHACCETIRANRSKAHFHKSLKIFERDILDLDPSEVLDSIGIKPGQLDVLVGGPPCQSFSTVGKRRTTEDPRGTLLWQFLRFVKVMQPKFFLMENVRGLLSAALRHRPIAKRPEHGGPPLAPDEEPGSVIRLFADDLQAIPKSFYHMDCFEVNAVNYGAPQLRERALFIGNRYNAVVDFPDPTHGPAYAVVRQNSLFHKSNGRSLPWKTLRDAIGSVVESNPAIMDFSPRKKKYLSLVPPGSNWRSLPLDLQQESMGRVWFAKGGRSGWWRRLSLDLPCPTLVTMPNHAGTSLCHPTETRALSLREYALIQEFPKDWEFRGKVSEQYAQIGNAVPVRLGQVAGEVIAKYVDELRARHFTVYQHKPEAYRIVYVQSHIRTRQWFKAGKTFVWQDGENNDAAQYASPRTKRKTALLN
jgi:DNA (cytosine-5)-methyltransferase 1